jgi:hypothetical protein
MQKVLGSWPNTQYMTFSLPSASFLFIKLYRSVVGSLYMPLSLLLPTYDHVGRNQNEKDQNLVVYLTHLSELSIYETKNSHQILSVVCKGDVSIKYHLCWTVFIALGLFCIYKLWVQPSTKTLRKCSMISCYWLSCVLVKFAILSYCKSVHFSNNSCSEFF